MSDDLPNGVPADPYCPVHGDQPTTYDSCSCVGRASIDTRTDRVDPSDGRVSGEGPDPCVKDTPEPVGSPDDGLRERVEALADEIDQHDYTPDCMDDGSRCRECTTADAIRATLTPTARPLAPVATFDTEHEFIQCPHETIRATCVGGCLCLCKPCAPSRATPTPSGPPRIARRVVDRRNIHE